MQEGKLPNFKNTKKALFGTAVCGHAIQWLNFGSVTMVPELDRAIHSHGPTLLRRHENCRCRRAFDVILVVSGRESAYNWF